MAQLTPDQFSIKWIPLLADNVFQDIDGPRLEALITDIKDSFADVTALRVPYRELPVGQVQDYASDGSLLPATLYRLTGRVAGDGTALDDVLAMAVTQQYLAGSDAYAVGIDAQTREEYLRPVSYDLATDSTTERGGGGPVDAYTRVQSDGRYVQISSRAGGYDLLPFNPTTTWNVAGKREAKARLDVAQNCRLAITNAADGWSGMLRLFNPSDGPVTMLPPTGSFGPKNYNPVLAVGERRILGFEVVVNELHFNTGAYYQFQD